MINGNICLEQEVNSLRDEIMSQQLNPSQRKDLDSKYEDIFNEKEELRDDDDILGMLSYITGSPNKASNAPSRYQEELSEVSREMEQSNNEKEEPSVSILKSARLSGLKSTSKIENNISQC